MGIAKVVVQVGSLLRTVAIIRTDGKIKTNYFKNQAKAAAYMESLNP